MCLAVRENQLVNRVKALFFDFDGTLLDGSGHREAIRATCREIASAHFVRHLRGSLRLYPEVLALLPSLRRRYRLALITNGASDTQRGSLRMLGIEQAFDAVAISGEVGVAKPDPAIFQVALRGLGFGPEQAWHIGDDALTDIAGAHAAGLTAVWLNRSESLWIHGEPGPHYEVSSLSELPKLLPV